MTTDLEREIEVLILRAMLAAGDVAVTDAFVRSAVRTHFQHVALTPGDVTKRISALEGKKLIAPSNDAMFGLMWALTPTGKNKAQQLR